MIDLKSIDLAANDYCELIKQDGSISVYRADIPKLGAIIIKQYELNKVFDKISFRRKQKNITRLYADCREFIFFPRLVHIGLTPDKKFGHVVYRQVKGVDLRKIEWDGFDQDLIHVTGKNIAGSLYKIHEKGWVHGDFKFGNVMLDLSSRSYKNVVDIKINNGILEPQLKDGNFDIGLHIVDVEAVKKPKMFFVHKKSRDIARFLINAEELGIKQLGIDFFTAYQALEFASDKDEKISVLHHEVKKWCDKIARRHKEKYGTTVKVDYL